MTHPAQFRVAILTLLSGEHPPTSVTSLSVSLPLPVAPSLLSLHRPPLLPTPTDIYDTMHLDAYL